MAISLRDIGNIIDEMSKKIDDVPNVVDRVVSETQDVILSLNRDQLLLGRNTLGEAFTPGYTDDPFFKTKEKAHSYRKMKERLEADHKTRMVNPQQYPDKNSNTPNLIVTGPFQNKMFINTSKGNYEIGSTYVDASKIDAKYENKVFGLAPKSKDYYYKNFPEPELIKHFKP